MASKSQEKALVELRKHCPEIFKDGQIDFHLLSEKYGQRPNHYEMFWNGKYESKESLKNPSLGCLRPVVGDSVNWDTTGNVFIEGDNLEVLKLMRKAYKGSVKCIYIDPPYNTGNDFVYKDNFKNGVEAYLEATNQVGNSNVETDGRFHTNWLNMIYPRLLVAKELLREDGCIFISIDDSEITNLRKVADEVLGESNFVGNFIWKKKDGNAKSDNFVTEHEYIVVYRKSSKFTWVHTSKERDAKFFDENGNGYQRMSLSKSGANSRREDRPTMYFPIKDPDGNDHYPTVEKDGEIVDGRWEYGEKGMAQQLKDNLVEFCKIKNIHGESVWKAYRKVYTPITIKDRSIIRKDDTEMGELAEKGIPFFTSGRAIGGSSEGSADLQSILGRSDVFSFPKPVNLIKFLLRNITKNGDIVLDFFAGSGTTAQAVMELNAYDGEERRWVLVQLPEKIEDSKQQKAMFNFLSELGKKKNIAEATKERIRRASKKVQDENPDYKGDLGFRVFKLDKSNFKKRYEPNKDGVDVRTPQQKWEDSLNAIRAERPMLDVFFEQALNDGISLSVGYKQHDVGGVKIFQANTNQIILTTDEFTFATAKNVSVAIIKMIKLLQRSGAGSQKPNVYFYGAALRSDPKTWLQIHTVFSQFKDDVAFNQL